MKVKLVNLISITFQNKISHQSRPCFTYLFYWSSFHCWTTWSCGLRNHFKEICSFSGKHREVWRVVCCFALQSGSSLFHTILVCSPGCKSALPGGPRTQITDDGASVHWRQHNHPTTAWLMTCLSENREKQARLLSSKLVQSDRWVEVVINPAVLAWKELEKEEKSSDISSFSKTGMSKTWRINCSNNSMSLGWEIKTFNTKNLLWFKKKTKFMQQ